MENEEKIIFLNWILLYLFHIILSEWRGLKSKELFARASRKLNNGQRWDLCKQLQGSNSWAIEVMPLAITYQKLQSSQSESLEMKRVINYVKFSMEEGWEWVASSCWAEMLIRKRR